MARALTAVAAEHDRITADNDRRATRKADDQQAREQAWIATENDRRAALTAAARQAAIDKPIFPREMAEKIAADFAKVAFPDWRLLKVESGGLLRQLIREQPEMKGREVKQRSEILTLIRGQLPGHIRPLVADLETIYSLIVTAQESAAFMVGYALGRKAERVYIDPQGLPRTRRRADADLRLHLLDGANTKAREVR